MILIDEENIWHTLDLGYSGHELCWVIKWNTVLDERVIYSPFKDYDAHLEILIRPELK